MTRFPEETDWSKSVAVVIPVLNGRAYIAGAIASVINQSRSVRIRLHVQDGNSKDGTQLEVERWLTIADSVPNLSMTFSSSEDCGIADALNRSFESIDADWYTWLGADDQLLPWAASALLSASYALPQFHWITGAICQSDSTGVPLSLAGALGSSDPPLGFSRSTSLFFRNVGGLRPVIQQEGTFVSREAFESIGKRIPTSSDLAFDFDLWHLLAHRYSLLQLSSPLAVFRKRRDQKSRLYASEYWQEVVTRRAQVSSSSRKALNKAFWQSQTRFVAYFHPSKFRWILRKRNPFATSLLAVTRKLVVSFSLRTHSKGYARLHP